MLINYKNCTISVILNNGVLGLIIVMMKIFLKISLKKVTMNKKAFQFVSIYLLQRNTIGAHKRC